MNTRDVNKPSLSVTLQRRWRAAAAGVLGLGVPRRKQWEPPTRVIAAGAALFAMASAALLIRSSRRALKSLLERIGHRGQWGRALGEPESAPR